MQLHHQFIKSAKRVGNKTAFNDRTTGRIIGYSKALTASLILSERFKKYREGFLGIMLPTSAGCALSILGTLMSGRTPVMINYSTGAENNARYAQKKCDFTTIITSKALLDKINCPLVDGMVFIEDIMAGLSIVEKLKAAIKSKLPSFLIISSVHSGSDDDNAVILFTSGSEKLPKAVQLTHKNIAANIESFSQVVSLTPDDVMCATLPFFHVFGLTVNMWAPLYHGMTNVCYANPLDYKGVVSIIRDTKPSMLIGTPSFLSGYLRSSESGDFKSLRLVVSGADKCTDAIRNGYLDKHGITVYEGYGTTETSPAVSLNIEGYNRPGSIGKVLPGVKVKIQNYETGEDCATGQVGRILVQGDLVMKGYLDDFEETSMRIRHGWYDTGDMGYLDDDGFLWHSGRLRRFVKIGGEMISLVKVEDVLEKALPDDTACCVVEVPDAQKGAKIVAAVSRPIDEKAVLRQMAASLPNIALPRQFFVVNELPKMGSGKIDFRGVADIVHERLTNLRDA